MQRDKQLPRSISQTSPQANHTKSDVYEVTWRVLKKINSIRHAVYNVAISHPDFIPISFSESIILKSRQHYGPQHITVSITCNPMASLARVTFRITPKSEGIHVYNSLRHEIEAELFNRRTSTAHKYFSSDVNTPNTVNADNKWTNHSEENATAPVVQIQNAEAVANKDNTANSSSRADTNAQGIMLDFRQFYLNHSVAVLTTIAVSFLLFIILCGMMINIAYHSQDGNISDLNQRIASLTDTVNSQKQEIDSFQHKQEELNEKSEQLDQLEEELSQQKEQQDQRQQEQDQREDELDVREENIALKEQQKAEALKQSQIQAQYSASQYSQSSSSPSFTPTSGSVYYKNCKAVWQALGHGITSNDPGYASDLDADGDGFACETEPNY